MEKVDKLSIRKTPYPVSIFIPLFIVMLTTVPTATAALPILLFEQLPLRLIAIAIAPAIFSLAYFGLAALLSAPFQKAIIRGKYPRHLSHFIYGPRRLYGLCWCAVFYFTPLYYALNTIPFMRKLMMWSFGYRGHPDITIAPDAWIRDLPLLHLGKGAYTANKCTLGTNVCLANGHVLVDSIILGTGAMVGHMAIVGPGVHVGDHSEIGIHSGIGIRASIGSRTRIGPTTTVNHGAEIGSSVDIGTMSYIGLKASIADGVRIPSCANVPEGAQIKSQEDVVRHLSVEKQDLSKELARLGEIYKSRVAL